MDKVPTSYSLLEQFVQSIEDGGLRFVDLSQPPRQIGHKNSIMAPIENDAWYLKSEYRQSTRQFRPGTFDLIR